MGFGISASVPKVEVPKVPAAPAVPKSPDLAGAASAAAAGLKSAVSGAAAGVTATAKGAAAGALDAVAKVGASLAGVAGALAEVAVTFQGNSVDIAMEPHMVLDANASYEDTKFEKGPVWIRVDMTPEKAKDSGETLHLYVESGGYDLEKPVKEFLEAGTRSVDVLFEEAPMDKSFTLEVIDARGKAHTMFSQVPYGDLRKTKPRI